MPANRNKKAVAMATAFQRVTKAANYQKAGSNHTLEETFSLRRRWQKSLIFDGCGVAKSLLCKAFCLTAQLAPLEYLYTLRGPVACLDSFIDRWQSVKKQVF